MLNWLAIDFSLTAISGNTDETSLRFGLTAGRETEATRLAIDSSWYFKQTDNTTTDNKFTVGARYDWLFPDSKWFWFAVFIGWLSCCRARSYWSVWGSPQSP